MTFTDFLNTRMHHRNAKTLFVSKILACYWTNSLQSKYKMDFYLNLYLNSTYTEQQYTIYRPYSERIYQYANPGYENLKALARVEYAAQRSGVQRWGEVQTGSGEILRVALSQRFP